MNKQSKDGNISWTDYTWNPIKGLCPVGCWYCYARAIYKRFGMPWPLVFNWGELHKPKDIGVPSKIFVCSTMEIFHPKVSREWRDYIFQLIELCPQHTFQILTKMPENIDRPMPDNVWLGITATGESGTTDILRAWSLGEVKAKVKFASFEPMLDFTFIGWNFNWLIIGRLTGHGKKYDPEKYQIRELVQRAKERNIPVFLKNNLKEIWGEKLIQEFPK